MLHCSRRAMLMLYCWESGVLFKARSVHRQDSIKCMKSYFKIFGFNILFLNTVKSWEYIYTVYLGASKNIERKKMKFNILGKKIGCHIHPTSYGWYLIPLCIRYIQDRNMSQGVIVINWCRSLRWFNSCTDYSCSPCSWWRFFLYLGRTRLKNNILNLGCNYGTAVAACSSIRIFCVFVMRFEVGLGYNSSIDYFCGCGGGRLCL